jgi:carbon-monoxide dehydrogenase small subunit
VTARVDIRFRVNGTERSIAVPPRATLADVLRDHLGLTGTHLGCEQGICGACTVLVDGHSARACTMLAVQVDQSDVWSVEGLSPPTGLSCLQRSFREHHGLQCGFCTPGLLVTATELLVNSGGDLTEAQVREEIGGNICRCTGYESIVDAVLAVPPGEIPGLPGAAAVTGTHLVTELTGAPDVRPTSTAEFDEKAADGQPQPLEVLREIAFGAAVFLAAAVAGAGTVRSVRRRRN